MEKVLIIQVCEVPVWHTHHGFTVFINLSSVLKNLSPVLTRHRVLSFQVCVWHTHTHTHTHPHPKLGFTVFINLSPVLTRHCVLSFLYCVRFHTHTHTPGFPLGIFGAGHRGWQYYILPANQLIYRPYFIERHIHVCRWDAYYMHENGREEVGYTVCARTQLIITPFNIIAGLPCSLSQMQYCNLFLS